jgi:hypothetical protein
MKIYPNLSVYDFNPVNGTILLQNDSDEKGSYIKKWTNINPQPTAEQLAATGV